MHADDPEHVHTTALDVIVAGQREKANAARVEAEREQRARSIADDTRLALAEMAPMAVAVIACRLYGRPLDGQPVSEDREETAWEILSRVGIPKLRATAVAASIFAAPQSPAPGSPGWAPPEVEESEVVELDPASVDAQIDSFIYGADAAQKIAEDRKEKGDGR